MKKVIGKKVIVILGLFLMVGLFPCSSKIPGKATAQEEPSQPPCPTPYIKLIKPKAALQGEEVSIRGRRFGEDQGQVFFSNETTAEIISWRNNRITVIVPENAVTGIVTIKRTCGSESNTAYFKMQEPESE
jgi:hypothetical protein